jgi:hypothetical protein
VSKLPWTPDLRRRRLVVVYEISYLRAVFCSYSLGNEMLGLFVLTPQKEENSAHARVSAVERSRLRLKRF